jgi:hypothetical protein
MNLEVSGCLDMDDPYETPLFLDDEYSDIAYGCMQCF